MTTPPPVINIRAKANQHAVFLILLAGVIFLIAFFLSQYYWRSHRLILIFFYLLTLVISFTGILKRSEPSVSIALTPQRIQYYHRHGHWTLAWQQIQSINTIKETVGLSTIVLPYVGIKLKSLDILAEQISPRLANRLIHEQRPLIRFAVMQNLLLLEEVQLNFTPYSLESGKKIKGPLAAFLYHCQVLQKGLGYHLYLPETSTDRELEDFCQLLKQCQRYAKNYQ